MILIKTTRAARRIITPAVALALVLAACTTGGGGGGRDGGTVEVVASVYPLAEVATRVGGDAVTVTNLTAAGSEPHELELTPRQVDRLQSADVVLFLGQGFQPAVEGAARRTSGRRLDVMTVVRPERAREGTDPHFWLDPTRMELAVRAVETTLVEAGADAPTLARNAAAYIEELDALDAEMAATLATCERRQIVTTHAAFSYLADRYELEQLPIAGLSPEAEPDPARLADLTDRIARQDITTVFSETLVSPAVAEALAREADVQTAVLNPIEGLSSEELEQGLDYADVMRQNLAALRRALSCTGG